MGTFVNMIQVKHGLDEGPTTIVMKRMTISTLKLLPATYNCLA